TDWAGRSIKATKSTLADYDATAGERRRQSRARSGSQMGDPVRGAAAIIKAVTSEDPPLRLLLGRPALEMAQRKLESLRKDFEAWKETTLGADFPEER
ncbi:MAG: short-chain dehydrogenase/reductase, partial [Cystobacter sp.]